MSHKDLLYNRVLEYFDSHQWKYTEFKDENRIRISTGLPSKVKSCTVRVSIKDNCIQMHATCPINASKDEYANVVEFITRLNYRLNLGNYEFDYRDGEVRYHVSIACDSSVPSIETIDRAFRICLSSFGRHGDGLLRNMMGYGNPAEDVRAIMSRE